MTHSISVASLHAKTIKFLSYRQRSEKEIKDYLVRKKANDTDIALVIELLKNERLIDDKMFAKAWFSSRVYSKPKSKRLISIELSKKGISKEIIEDVLGDQETYISDEDLAKKIVEKKITSYKNLSRDQLYEKLVGQLGRRGFNWETIKKVLAHYT
jgi:regulatory protein